MASLGTSKKTGKAALLLLFGLFCVSALIGQDIRVEASVSRNPVMPGENVGITVTVHNGKGEVQMKQIAGLQFMYGPSMSSNVTIVNGQRSTEYGYTYTFRALNEGTVRIPEIEVRTAAGTLKTQPIELKITKGSDSSISGNFIVAIEPSKRKVYLGEPIIVAYKIYQLYGNGFRPETYEFPEFTGFWPESVDDHQGRWEAQVINGQRYSVATLKVDVLFPQKTGTFTVDGFKMTSIVGSMWNRQRVSASSKPITIEVLPHPGGKPENFLGTFKNMNIEVKASETELKANEALTVSVTYSGSGSLRLLREPQFNWPPDLEVYDPEVKDRINVTATGVSGKRTYEYLVIPRTAGNYQISVPSASWFNPREKKYISRTFDPIDLKVARGEGSADMNYTFSSKSDVQVLNKDIRFIRPTPGLLLRQTDLFFRSFGYYFLYILPALGFVLAVFIHRRRKGEAANERGLRMRKAGRTVKKFLREAEQAKTDPTKFYEALSRGLEHYALDKLGLDRSELSRQRIEESLSSGGSAELATAFAALYDRCQMARYAPSAAEDPSKMLNDARGVIAQIENAR